MTKIHLYFLTEKHKNESQYYVAVLYAGYVWVAASQPIHTGIAKLIMFANNPTVGVWATKESYARGLCGGPYAIWHNYHDSSEGYFYHFHHPALDFTSDNSKSPFS